MGHVLGYESSTDGLVLDSHEYPEVPTESERGWSVNNVVNNDPTETLQVSKDWQCQAILTANDG